MTAAGPGRAVAQETDVTDETGIERMAARAIAEFGRVDILVNAAGLGGFGPVHRLDAALLDRVPARELGPAGITVNAVVPGYIDTAMNSSAAADFRRAIVGRTALRRLGTADDVARVCLFPASDDAAFVTGAAVPVDGGLMS